MKGQQQTSTLHSCARLFRLWKLYGSMDLLWVARDVPMFLMWALADSVMTVASVTAMWLLAERFHGIGHWSKDQVLFMLGYGAVATGMVDFCFGYNVSYISRRLGRGQFDHTLIQPQPIWMTLLTEGFVPISGAVVLVPGIALLSYAISRLGLLSGPIAVAELILNLLASAAILLAFQYLWGSLAFRAPRAAEEISSSTMQLMTQLSKYPLDGLGPRLTGSLLTALPVGFIAWYPSRALLGLQGSSTGVSVWVTPVAALIFAMAALGAWRVGMAYYDRVGSQRYSDRGHRS